VTEHWKAVPGYEGHYEVSDQGNVRSLDRLIEYDLPTRWGGTCKATRRFPATLLKTWNVKGYPAVNLTVDRSQGRTHFYVHTLVLLAFVGPPPADMEACHWDDVPSNNRLSNLRWDTKAANAADKIRNQDKKKAKVQK
jgi:hypothetical protein